MINLIFICGPLLICTNLVSNWFGVGRVRKSATIGQVMGVTIEGIAAKIGKNTHLLVMMCVRLSQKIGLLNLTNRTRLQKGNG